MSSGSDSTEGGSSFRHWFPPLNRQSLFRHYIPLTGAICHTGVACHILSPEALPKLIPKYDLAVANLAVLNSSVALGYWLYHRSHMRKASNSTRLMYSAYLASCFNFGSILLWALTKYALPKNFLVRSVFGGLTSVCLLMIGKEYMAYVDFLATDINESN